jgi:hypothetical protein
LLSGKSASICVPTRSGSPVFSSPDPTFECLSFETLYYIVVRQLLNGKVVGRWCPIHLKFSNSQGLVLVTFVSP